MCCKFLVLDTPGSLTPDDNNDAEMNIGDDVDKYYHHDQLTTSSSLLTGSTNFSVGQPM